MPLRIRLLVTGLLVALPVSLFVFWSVQRLRELESAQVLERVSAAFLTEINRETCEEDSRWFIAGPRTGRPSMADRQQPDADVRLPRPSTTELPFEFFPFDDNYLGTSTASPRFPDELRREFGADPSLRVAMSSYQSSTGTGLQVARRTGWVTGPCSVLLFRNQPLPNSGFKSLSLFVGIFAACFAVAVLSGYPTIARVRRLTHAARESARADYEAMTPISGKDEINSLAFIFNEAAADIRRRAVDSNDREEALRRYVTHTTEDVAQPLASLEDRLAELQSRGDLPGAARDQLRDSIREAHRLVSRLTNLASVTALRKSGQVVREPIDMKAVVERVIERHRGLARALDVTIEQSVPATPVTYSGSPALLEQAITNVVGNAVLHNAPGGRVQVELKGYERDARFALRVTDNGPGVTDDEFAALTANKRFRGDEGRSGRGGRGLGLAIAREVTDRLGLKLDLRRPSSGGFEVEIG